MDKELRDPEIEKLLKQIRLKQPSERELADFVSGVRTKIAEGYGARTFGLRQIGIMAAAGLALAGLAYLAFTLFWVSPVPLKPQAVVEFSAQSKAKPPSAAPGYKPLSIEEEMAVLEALSEEFPDETADLLAGDELLDEFAMLDELELSAPAPA